MRRKPRGRAALAAFAVVVAACAGDAPTSIDPDIDVMLEPAAEGALGLARLLRAWPREPCAGGPYRDFDFWVGEWDVFNPAGAQVGTNRIELLMDGCVVSENWVNSGGQPGRSINTYDSDTGMWHQTWVSPNPIGHIRMAGGLADGTMIMDGVRTGATFSLVDHYEWEEVEPDVVLQSGFRDVPEFGLHFPFALTYRRAPDFDPVPTVETRDCQPGGSSEATRQADFLLGIWTLATAKGRTIGTVEIDPDLSGCLFDERFATRKGLRSIAFLYFDPVVDAWYRTSIDTEGDRVELSGSLVGGILTLEGREPGPNGALVDVRYSWEPENANRVRYRIESAKKGQGTGHGADGWRTEAALLLLRM